MAGRQQRPHFGWNHAMQNEAKSPHNTTDACLPRQGVPGHVLITGATSGLGRALAEHYAAPGCTLAIAGRNAERLQAVAEACRNKGATVVAQQVDVRDAPAMESWLIARDQALSVDILIANAGIGGADVMPPVTGEDGELARNILAVNTIGVVNSVTPILPRMVARGRGRIALVGSISGSIGLPHSPVYCASKAAVQIYGDGLRRLVARRGVSVTTVLPGFIDTPMSRSLDLARLWCWPAEKAARRIAHDIARGRRRCVFPWQLRFLIALQDSLPLAVSDFFLSRARRDA